MKKWSDKLIELSEEYFNYSGTSVKSTKAEFGILNIDYDKNIYTIILHDSDIQYKFNSVNEMIQAGWAVD